MKFLVFSTFALFVFLIGSPANPSAATPIVKGDSHVGLNLSLDSSQKTYKLGEKLDFSFVLRNIGKEEIKLTSVFETGPGFLNLKCSATGVDFSGCSDPTWGKVDVVVKYPTIIKPGESIFTTDSILWNWKSQDVPTYRFLKPGVYYISAIYKADLLGEGGRSDKFELRSEPVGIEIEEPRGEDLEAWNSIKDDGKFAYFMQKDELFRLDKVEERKKFLQKIEDIISVHPTSFYAERLRESLSKFKSSEEKRKATMEKQKSLPPK